MSELEKLTKLSKELIVRYEKSKRTDGLEPFWILSPYDIAYEFDKDGIKGLESIFGDMESKELIEEATCTLESMMIPDATCLTEWPFPSRVIHDGFKVGTTSWVFMGRKDSPIHKITPSKSFYYQDEVIVISRKIPPEIAKLVKSPHQELEPVVYCGYCLNPNIKVDIGPCMTIEEVQNIFDGHGKVTISSF